MIESTGEKMPHAAILSILLACAFAQTSSVPYASGTDGPGPTFKSEQVSNSYPGTYASFRKINFRNFRLFSFDEGGKPAGSVLLRNGHYAHDEPFDHEAVDLVSTYHLGHSSSSDGDSVLVLLDWFTGAGSSSVERNAKVFTLSGGRLRVVQEIDWDIRFQAGLPTVSFEPTTNTLLIRSAHYIPGDAHCCISAMDVVTFRWDGSHFVQAGIQTELSEYGKRKGKTLPR